MANYVFFVGVDVSKVKLDFVLRKPCGGLVHFCVPNSKAGYVEAARSMATEPGFSAGACLLCMEHTGIYALGPAAWFKEAGYAVWVEPASRILQGSGKLIRGKDDKVDAVRIAEYACRFSDRYRPWHPTRPVVAQLRELSNTRERLMKAAQMLGVPLRERRNVLGSKGPVDNEVAALVKRIKAQVKDVERKTRELIRHDAKLAGLHRLITSVMGVADITATALIIATNEFQDFADGRKLACHAGCAPFSRTSGTSIRGKARVSGKADRSLKAKLSQCAWTAATHAGDLRDYYLRKVAEGKNKYSVINAIRGKIIMRICACVRDGREWTPAQPSLVKN